LNTKLETTTATFPKELLKKLDDIAEDNSCIRNEETDSAKNDAGVNTFTVKETESTFTLVVVVRSLDKALFEFAWRGEKDGAEAMLMMTTSLSVMRK